MESRQHIKYGGRGGATWKYDKAIFLSIQAWTGSQWSIWTGWTNHAIKFIKPAFNLNCKCPQNRLG